MSDSATHTPHNRFAPSSIRTGGLMLLVLVVAVFLVVLCVLCVQMANTEQARSNAYAQTTTDTFATEQAANAWLAQVDAALARDSSVSALRASLPEGTQVDANTISAVIVGTSLSTGPSEDTVLGSGSIADSGMSDRNITSNIELKISVTYKGSAYTVTQWEKSRVYE